MRFIRNLREQVAELERRGLLARIGEPVCKDTELHPLVRLQFLGRDANDRKGFLFENVTDARGRSFDAQVAVGIMAASRAVYTAGLGCESTEEVYERWQQGLNSPIPTVEASGEAPVHEVVLTGEDLVGEGAGLDGLPIPISTPGFDPAPYITAGHWHTVDPDTGIRNVGNYRGQLKATNKTGVYVAKSQHIGIHWEKARQAGKPLEAAVVVGVPPAVSYCAVAKIPYGIDELTVAGGMVGEPIETVPCKTVDISVPAEAEVVIEGRIHTDYRELEGPFGEYHGYMAGPAQNPVFEVTAITRRRRPIWVSFLSQKPPSESTQIRQIANESIFNKFLRNDCNNPSVLEVGFPQYAGSYEMIVIRMKPTNPAAVWQALNAAVALEAGYGKVIVAVDDDIDIRDSEAIWWAINYHTQPHRDFRILRGKVGLAPYSVGPDIDEGLFSALYPDNQGASAVLIDATRKWPYPPVSLPPKESMERAVERWHELGLGELKDLSSPWYGRVTSRFGEELVEAAERAVRGDFETTGKLREETRTDT